MVIDIGGYDHSSVREGLELVTRIHKYYLSKNKDYKVMFVSEPGCWTEVPEKLSTLRHQRSRWSKGLVDVFISNPDMIANPRYRKIGLIAFPSLKC